MVSTAPDFLVREERPKGGERQTVDRHQQTNVRKLGVYFRVFRKNKSWRQNVANGPDSAQIRSADCKQLVEFTVDGHQHEALLPVIKELEGLDKTTPFRSRMGHRRVFGAAV